MARKEYEYEIVWVGQPNNDRNNTWKGRQELIDMGYQKMVGAAHAQSRRSALAGAVVAGAAPAPPCLCWIC